MVHSLLVGGQFAGDCEADLGWVLKKGEKGKSYLRREKAEIKGGKVEGKMENMQAPPPQTVELPFSTEE